MIPKKLPNSPDPIVSTKEDEGSSAFTKDNLNALMERLSIPTTQRSEGVYFLSVSASRALEVTFPFRPANNARYLQTPAELLGSPIVTMPRQKADCLVIYNKLLSEAYIAGTVSEEELMDLLVVDTQTTHE